MSVVEAGHPVARTQAPFHPQAGYPRHRWTVAEYHKMGEVGLLRQADRVELIEGELFAMAPIGSPHGGEVNYLVRCFSPLMTQDKIILAVQNPITLPDDSEPQPDIAVLRWSSGVDGHRLRRQRKFPLVAVASPRRASHHPA